MAGLQITTVGAALDTIPKIKYDFHIPDVSTWHWKHDEMAQFNINDPVYSSTHKLLYSHYWLWLTETLCVFFCCYFQVAPLCVGRAGACVVAVRLWKHSTLSHWTEGYIQKDIRFYTSKNVTPCDDCLPFVSVRLLINFSQSSLTSATGVNCHDFTNE